MDRESPGILSALYFSRTPLNDRSHRNALLPQSSCKGQKILSMGMCTILEHKGQFQIVNASKCFESLQEEAATAIRCLLILSSNTYAPHPEQRPEDLLRTYTRTSMATIGFLSLPPEIRCMVYAFHFAGAVATRYSRLYPEQPNLRGGLSKEWQVLLTCRLVKQEARPIMYKSTLYVLDAPEYPGLFNLRLPHHPSLRSEFRRMGLLFNYRIIGAGMLRPLRHAVQLLWYCRRLNYLEIDTVIGSRSRISPEDWATLQSHPGCLIAGFRPQDQTIMDCLAEAIGPRVEVTVQDYCLGPTHVLRRRYMARTHRN